MTESERNKIKQSGEKRRQWIPVEWAVQMLRKAYEKGQIDESHYVKLCESILNFRERLQLLMCFDWVNVPLVYTQVVNICTLSYFAIRCISTQAIQTDSDTDDNLWIKEFTIPVFAIFEFVFFVGWLKVAQVMINPFGLDDDDFEIDLIIERNLAVAYSYVDDMYEKLPPLVAINLETLPHTKASAALITKMNPMVGSAAGVHVPDAQQRVLSKEDTEAIRALVQPMNLVRRLSKSPSHIEYTAPAPSVEDLPSKPEQSIQHQPSKTSIAIDKDVKKTCEPHPAPVTSNSATAKLSRKRSREIVKPTSGNNSPLRILTPALNSNVSRQLPIKKEVDDGLISRAVEDLQLKIAVEQKRDRLKHIINPTNDDGLDLTQENSSYEPTCRPPQSSPYDSRVSNSNISFSIQSTQNSDKTPA